MKKAALWISAVATLIGMPAWAADMAVKARPMPPAPVYGWTGCYIGGNVGGGWARNDVTDFLTVPGFDIGRSTGTGIVGGGQVGCDYQMANWVFGAQGMFDGAEVKGSLIPNGALAPPNPVGFSRNEVLGFKTEWLATVTGRIGYLVQPQALIYVKGGAAWAHNTYSDNDPILVPPFFGNGSATHTGWTIGGGFEYAFTQNWSFLIEYDFSDFGSRNTTIWYNTANTGVVNPYGYNFKPNLQTVLFGVNYRFGGPVVARY